MEKREAQLAKMKEAEGFIAALDQSGGSTPKALALYGVDEKAWSNDIEMFDLVHAMRCRIIESPAFTGNRVIAAILFENTMKNVVDEIPTSSYLWGRKQILPILKIDKGLAEEIGGVQMMKPMPTLDNTLADATDHEIFGTKMRSVIKRATELGIKDVVEQQFDIGKEVLAAGMPQTESWYTASIVGYLLRQAANKSARWKPFYDSIHANGHGSRQGCCSAGGADKNGCSRTVIRQLFANWATM